MAPVSTRYVHNWINVGSNPSMPTNLNKIQKVNTMIKFLKTLFNREMVKKTTVGPFVTWIFDPKEDITAYELYKCKLIPSMPLSGETPNDFFNRATDFYNQLPTNCKRHFVSFNKHFVQLITIE